MKKYSFLLVLIIGFVLGFYTNSVLLYQAPNQLIDFAFSGRNRASSLGIDTTYKSVVYFDGKRFNPAYASVRISRDFQIINTSKTTPMDLVFEDNSLNSRKIYGEQESFHTIFRELGTQSVYARGIPGATLQITVVEDK